LLNFGFSDLTGEEWNHEADPFFQPEDRMPLLIYVESTHLPNDQHTLRPDTKQRN